MHTLVVCSDFCYVAYYIRRDVSVVRIINESVRFRGHLFAYGHKYFVG